MRPQPRPRRGCPPLGRLHWKCAGLSSTARALILAEVVTLSAFQVWEEWINVALGAWLVVSPWALRGVGPAASADFVVVGLLVVALAAYEMWQIGNARGRGA